MESNSPKSEPRRILDVVIPSYNRPKLLYELLASGLELNVPGMNLVVIDDASTVVEQVRDLGEMSTQDVCESFHSDRVIYFRNPENMGLARSWERYHRELCDAHYTMSVVDKDEFVDPEPIANAIAKLDADPAISMVMLPLRQRDRVEEDRSLEFDYPRMSGREFLARYVEDNLLQHCGMYGVIRVSAAHSVGLPRPMYLRRYGLDDAFGIDIDFLLKLATTGDFEFENKAHVRRSLLEGATERYPLTFAYTYFQYAKRIMRELRTDGYISREAERTYIGFWLLLISRGLRVAYRPVHGSELEPGTKRIQPHVKIPIHLYLLLHFVRYRVIPNKEMRALYFDTAKIMIRDAFSKRFSRGPANEERGLPPPASR